MFPALKWPLTAACEWRFATTWLVQFYAPTSRCHGGTMARRGWHHTEESKAHLRATNLGRTVSVATRAKIRAAKLGVKKSPETIAKIRAAKANAPRGPAHACWKGGQKTSQGRVFDYMDLGRGSNNYVQRARRIAEELLGRPLRTDEHVHHKNGDTMDDRPENLEVLSSSAHSRHHAAVRPRDPVTGRWPSKTR